MTCEYRTDTLIEHDVSTGEQLSKHVKQARDALVLYALEESDSSEDEKELDQYLQTQIDNYIESKTAQQLIEASPSSVSLTCALVCLSVCLSVYLSVYLLICLSVHSPMIYPFASIVYLLVSFGFTLMCTSFTHAGMQQTVT
jgi:hypothetical protein